MQVEWDTRSTYLKTTLEQALGELVKLLEQTPYPNARAEITDVIERRATVEIFINGTPCGLSRDNIIGVLLDEHGYWQFPPTVDGWREAFALLGKFSSDSRLGACLSCIFGEPEIRYHAYPCQYGRKKTTNA